MARSGLRMMPTSPSPPLKFRTAGFPRYGFKASMSSRAFLQDHDLKPIPGIQPPPTHSLLPPATPGGVTHFGAASFALCYGLHVCLALLTGYDEMKSRALHRAF